MTDFALTDVGNGKRLAARHGDRLRWVAEWKRWMVWDGERWSSDAMSQGQVDRWAVGTVLAIGSEEAEQAEDEKEAEELRGWCLKSQSHFRIRAMMSLARHVPGIAVSVHDLDNLPQEGHR